MEWRQLEYFRKTAALEHISKTAEELHLTQPSLTMSIRKLENELGVALFDRRGRNIVLNDFGKLFLERVNTIFDIMDQTKIELNDMRTSSANRLIVMTPPPLYNPSLTDILFDIAPNIMLTPLRFTRDPRDMLLDGSLDMCISTPCVRDPRISTYPLVRERNVVLMPKEHPLVSRSELTLSDLREQDFVSYKPGIPARARLENSCCKNDFKPHVVFEGATLRDITQHMLLCGPKAVSIVSAFAVSIYNLDGLAVVTLADDEMVDDVMELCWVAGSGKERLVQPIARAVKEFFSEHFPTQSKAV